MPNEVSAPGTELYSSAEKLGELIARELKIDKRLYLFSPDETTSNKLDKVYGSTERAWALPKKDWDLPESDKGRVIELLSENVLFATMIGHILGNHERAYMASYESFFSIITSQILQHIKFLKQASETNWRKKQGNSEGEFPAVNLLSTSTCWRQDHNGFSHQSPALISTLLDVPSSFVNCIFPVDDVSTTAVFDFMNESRDVVNLVTFNKTEEPRWIDRRHAKFQIENGGASIFGFMSDENPEVIFTAAGDIVTRETIYAMRILREEIPGIKMRFVGILALTNGVIGFCDNKFSQEQFDDYFTTDAPIIGNFHGYPSTLKTILSNYASPERLYIHGFRENGSTTTPFEMLAMNGASRYNLVITVAKLKKRDDLVEKYEELLRENREFARENGVDKVTEHL
ncbi:MAG: hypothetical protein Q4F60_01050 [Candidatus Saccharibacteria bacterium]|nr:hypothetical protein [Candidatus Saccharibacteria bacterium]